MPDPIIVGVAPTIEYTYTPGTAAYIDVPIIGARKGDWVVVWNYWRYAYMTATPTVNPTPPAGWTVMWQNLDYATTGGLVAKFQLITDTLTSVRLTMPSTPAAPTSGLLTWPHIPLVYAGSTTIRHGSDVKFEGQVFGIINGSVADSWKIDYHGFTTSTPKTLAMNVGLIGRKIGSPGGAGPWSPVADPIWVTENSTSTTGAYNYYSSVLRSRQFDTTLPIGNMAWTSTSDPDFGITYSFSSYRLVDSTPARPGQPAPVRLRLGCATSYRAFITDGSYRTTIAAAPAESIKCERVLDEISGATIVVPDRLVGAYCTAELAGLVPMDYGLLIERDDAELWSGAITGLSRDTEARTLTITGSDALARLSKTYAKWVGEYNYVDADAAIVMRDIINLWSVQSANQWSIICPDFTTGQPLTRSLYAARREYAWDIVKEILDSAVDAYMMKGELYCWSQGAGWVYYNGRQTVAFAGPYNRWFGLEYGIFTNQAFSRLPNWSISGMDQANFVDAPYADVGEKGYRLNFNAQDPAGQERSGVLAYCEPNAMHRPDQRPPAANDAAFQRRADSLLASKHIAPAVMSGGVLSEDAPIDVDHLRPGAIWRLDIHDFGFTQLLQSGVLKRVEFSWDGTREAITPTIVPLGFQDET